MRFVRGLALFAAVLSGCSAPDPAPPSSRTADSGAPIVWTDVTADAGLGAFRHQTGAVGNKWYPEPMGGGGGFIDYDGDGWQDIVLAGGGNWEADPARQPQSLFLYRNQGDGTFAEVTEAAGLRDAVAYTIGVAVADYDNDGDEDLFVTNLRKNLFFRNDGGRFTDITEAAGLSDEAVWSSSAMFFDANKDGWLDLYVGNYVDWTPETDIFCPPGGTVKLYCIPSAYTGIQSRLFINDGDGTFTDVTEPAGIAPSLGKALGVAELDYNRDGWSDIVVVNDGEGDLLYRNNQDGTFTELGARSGLAFSEHGEARAGMGVDAGVVDSSGMVSVFVGNFSEEMVGVYRYLGNESFLDRSAVSRIGYPSLLILTFGVMLFDADYDTDLDLFLANGHVYPDRIAQNDKVTYRQASQLYMNRGDGVFDLYEPTSGVLTQQMVARAIVLADYDRDGDQDILLTENGGPVHLWRNDREDPPFLRVVLRGRQGNRDAIGAEVTAVVDGLRMIRRVRSGSSYLASSEKAVNFGLGRHATVDTLQIVWPSGQTTVATEVPGRQAIQFVEGQPGYTTVPLPGRLP
ncbi:MAG: CRTAC1 family protein [Rhodothermales bacterium]